MIKTPTVYFFTGLAIIALIFLSISYWLVRAAWLGSMYVDNGLTSASVTNGGSSVVIDDPLITTVPVEQQSAEQKTKVFVSSLDPIQGDNSAKVFIIFYGSLLDSDMQSYFQLMPQLTEQYALSEVAFIWKDYVTEDVEESAAVVGHCANEQNRFWEYSGALARRTGDDTAALMSVANSIGTSAPDMEECVNNAGYAAQVEQNHYSGQVLGVTNGHTLFINDRLYTEPITADQITQTIDDILATYQ